MMKKDVVTVDLLGYGANDDKDFVTFDLLGYGGNNDEEGCYS